MVVDQVSDWQLLWLNGLFHLAKFCSSESTVLFHRYCELLLQKIKSIFHNMTHLKLHKAFHLYEELSGWLGCRENHHHSHFSIHNVIENLIHRLL